MLNIKIKSFVEGLILPEKTTVGDWIDLRASQDITLEKGDFALIPLGIAMKLPEGYEANIVPRSSTFKNFGLLQTNSFGIADETYCGDNDQYFMPVYATRFIKVNKNDRICQFRINKKMPDVSFEVVEKMEDANRGGCGSSGIK